MRPLKTWVGCILLVVAVYVGAAIFSAIRMLMYEALEIRSEMGPGLFVLFSPILATPIAALAVLFHVALARWFAFTTELQWIGAGVAYSSVLLGLINPWLLLIPLALNPVTLKRTYTARPRTWV